MYKYRPTQAFAWAETWRRVWGRRKKYLEPKISGLLCFVSFICKIAGDPLSSPQAPISQSKNSSWGPYSQFVLCITSDNTSSQNIEGTDAWAVPSTSNFWGTVPSFSLSLRLWAWAYYKHDAKNYNKEQWHQLDSMQRCAENWNAKPFLYKIIMCKK